MKKEYEAPFCELVAIDARDVITTSDWTLPELPVDGTGNQSSRSTFGW